MPLTRLIASPGESITGRLAKNWRINSDAHAELVAAIDAAVAAEREACANVCDERAIANLRDYDAGDAGAVFARHEAQVIARKIRERTQPSQDCNPDGSYPMQERDEPCSVKNDDVMNERM
jgi:hypothetical protein